MFTGIVRDTGTIKRIDERGGDLRLTITSPNIAWQELDDGESIAVNGVCLTAVRLNRDGFVTDVSTETLGVTTLGELATGSRVNLEPSLRLGDTMGGHIVSGHVDCVGEVLNIRSEARSVRLEIGVPRDFTRYIATKGSITVDGVSLTVNAVSDETFEVNIIPHTADVTIVRDYQAGTRVNVEVDMLARYLERLGGTASTDVPPVHPLQAQGYG